MAETTCATEVVEKASCVSSRRHCPLAGRSCPGQDLCKPAILIAAYDEDFETKDLLPKCPVARTACALGVLAHASVMMAVGESFGNDEDEDKLSETEEEKYAKIVRLAKPDQEV